MIGAVVLLAFTLVADGDIIPVESVGTAKSVRLSATALTELANRKGMAVNVDPTARIISIANGTPRAVSMNGFTGNKVVIVVRGKIFNSPSRPVRGVPHISAQMLKTVAEAMGYTVSLDTAAGVMSAQGGKKGSATPSGTGAASVAAPKDVCGYMDALKRLWDGSEPSLMEKVGFRRLAADFQAMNSGAMKKDESEVDELKKLLKSFGAKVDRREEGTKNLEAPAGAQDVQAIGLEFLAEVQKVLSGSHWLTEEMNPDSKVTKQEAEAQIAGIQEADRQVQKIGARFNKEVLRVRTRNGCGPP